MNQAQRNFLINKITTNVNNQIKLIEKQDDHEPSMDNFILAEVLSGRFKIKTLEEIRQTIINKAENNSKRDWLTSGYNFSSSRNGEINFKISEIFIIPERFIKLHEEWKERDKNRREIVHNLKTQMDTLVTRIQLASDKVLQQMINEVDDLGDISLYDEKLKQLTGVRIDQKQIGNGNDNKGTD